MPTTVSIPEELADELYDRKERGESYADVIRRLIEQAENSGETAGSDTTADADASPDTAPDGTRPDEPAVEAPATLDEHVDAVASDVLPGSGAKLEERQAAFRAVVDYLREHGTATPAEFREEVYPAHPARYESGKDPARSWWKNAMYPALAELAGPSNKIEKPDQTGEWEYTGE